MVRGRVLSLVLGCLILGCITGNVGLVALMEGCKIGLCLDGDFVGYLWF